MNYYASGFYNFLGFIQINTARFSGFVQVLLSQMHRRITLCIIIRFYMHICIIIGS